MEVDARSGARFARGRDEDDHMVSELLSLGGPLARFARKLDAQDSDDMVQEVWLRFLTRRPKIRESSQAWLIKVTISIRADRGLAHRHRRDAEYVWAEAARTAADLSTAAGEEQVCAPGCVVGALRSLPPGYREVIRLLFLEGFSLSEVARALGLPRATVRTRSRRGLDMLRRMLGPSRMDGGRPLNRRS